MSRAAELELFFLFYHCLFYVVRKCSTHQCVWTFLNTLAVCSAQCAVQRIKVYLKLVFTLLYSEFFISSLMIVSISIQHCVCPLQYTLILLSAYTNAHGKCE